jgi:hypothetical protein
MCPYTVLNPMLFVPGDNSARRSLTTRRVSRVSIEAPLRIHLNRQISALEDEIELLIRDFKEDLVRHYIRESAERLRRLSRRFRKHLGELTPTAPYVTRHGYPQ